MPIDQDDWRAGTCFPCIHFQHGGTGPDTVSPDLCKRRRKLRDINGFKDKCRHYTEGGNAVKTGGMVARDYFSSAPSAAGESARRGLTTWSITSALIAGTSLRN